MRSNSFIVGERRESTFSVLLLISLFDWPSSLQMALLFGYNANVKLMCVADPISSRMVEVMRRGRKRRSGPLSKSEQMARVRGADTGPEMILRRSLWQAGLRYRVRPRIPGRPDLAFVGCKIAVFVDGCFWHGCEEHYKAPATNAPFWSEKIARNRKRDQDVEAALGKLGWTVLRFWEHEVEDDIPSVIDRIRSEITRSRNDAPTRCKTSRKTRTN